MHIFMKKLLTAITLFAISTIAMAQSYVIYEWKDSVPTIRNISDIDSITYYLPEDLIKLVTGSPIETKRTSMTSEFELVSEITFADSTISEQGICFSLSNATPTIEDGKAKFGSFYKGLCEVTITGLENGTYYYYRPYFMVADNVYYGPVKTFSTWEAANNGNPAIAEVLEEAGTFNMYQRLLADPDINFTESTTRAVNQVLSKPGAKTLFAATDEAWQNFFEANKKLPKSNPWHYAQSYETLSKNQKRLLFHTSLLHHAIASEHLSSSSDETPVRGCYLRKYTDVVALDSVTRVAVTDLPVSYWSVDRQAGEEGTYYPEPDQWGRIRNGGLLGYDSIYMVQDSSSSMMVYLTKDYMVQNKITAEDYRIITGVENHKGNVHIYDACIDSADILCENGYINMMSKPLVPMTNMAELIRTNGRTNIYSHLLERFSVPFQNKVLGGLYSKMNSGFSERDTLYTKRYYSRRSYGSTTISDQVLVNDEKGNYFAGYRDAVLKFDPGWNGYFPYGATAESDMGAMFVPNDEQMLNFFNNGGGRNFVEEFAKNNRAGHYTLDDLHTLYKDIDQIPLYVIQTILNYGMFNSFAGSVPSKMQKLRSYTGSFERIFSERDTKLTKNGGTIDTVLVACNGAVYVMNNMFTPSDYNCVASPAYVGSGNMVMRWAIYSDYDGQRYMGLNYYAYLKVMENQMSFFIPTDEAMQYHYDPMSFTSRNPRVMRFCYTKGNFPFATKSYQNQAVLADFDVTTGIIGRDLSSQSLNNNEIIDRLRLLLQNHTIAHDQGINAINTEEDEYYLSKHGMGIKVTRDVTGVVRVQGGFQLENEREGLQHNHPGILYCNVIKKGEYKNGWAFTLDAPMIPAARSVFSVLSNIQRGQLGDPSNYSDAAVEANNPYLEFFKLCNQADWDLIVKSGLVDENDPKYDTSTSEGERALQNAVSKYMTFVDNNSVDYNVKFFSNYNYTVFAPTNEAIREAIAKGLPTWESIRADYEKCVNEYGELTKTEDRLRIQAKIVYLTNFVRAHFADKSVFADKSEMQTELFTNSYNRDKGTFGVVFVQRQKNGNKTNLMVKDNTDTGKWMNVISEYNGRDVKNIMTCDRVCNSSVKNQNMNNKTTDASSYAVIHLINGVLNHEMLDADGTYPSFTNTNAARQYIQRFSIR